MNVERRPTEALPLAFTVPRTYKVRRHWRPRLAAIVAGNVAVTTAVVLVLHAAGIG